MKNSCKCGWNHTMMCSHIQFGKYTCQIIRSMYDIKVVNGELIYVLKNALKKNL